MNVLKSLGLGASIACLMAQSFSLTATSTSNPKSDAVLQKEINYYVNQYRQQHGLSALTLDPRISAEATKHSQDMARHTIPFGHQYFPARVKHLYSQIKRASGAAENVAYNYKDSKYLVSEWVKSPGHRRNIQGHYKLTGIGIARDSQGKMYFTQIFINN